MPPDTVARALLFAMVKHGNQKRKGPSAQPYVVHPTRVAAYLLKVTNDESLAAAGALHDVIEDCGATYEQLLAEFGREVADIVAEVTDDPAVPKNKRKDEQVRKMPQLSHKAQLLKIADQMDNVRDIGIDPPVGWSVAKRRDYVHRCQLVVASADGVSGTMHGDHMIRDFDYIAVQTLILIEAQGSVAKAP